MSQSFMVRFQFGYQDDLQRALYLNLKEIDLLLNKHKFREASDFMRQLTEFLESRQLSIDYREIYLVSPKSKAIVDILW